VMSHISASASASCQRHSKGRSHELQVVPVPRDGELRDFRTDQAIRAGNATATPHHAARAAASAATVADRRADTERER
jgi:hypothetical protein